MKVRCSQVQSLRRFIIGLLFSTCWTLSGCGFTPAPTTTKPLAPPPSLPTLTAPAVEAAKQAQTADAPLVKIERAVADLPPSPQRETLTANLSALRQWFATNLAAWNTMVADAKAQDATIKLIDRAMKDRDDRITALQADATKANAKIAKLEAGDPVVTRLNWAGLGCIVAAVAALGVGIWLNIIALRNLSFVLAGIGLAILTLARYLHTLELIAGALAAVAIVGAVVYFILHKKISPVVKATRDLLATAAPGAFAPAADGAPPAPTALAAQDTAGALASVPMTAPLGAPSSSAPTPHSGADALGVA